jgi:hypothetical protein
MAEQYKPMTTKNALNSKIRYWRTRQVQLRKAWLDYDVKIENAYQQLKSQATENNAKDGETKHDKTK